MIKILDDYKDADSAITSKIGLWDGRLKSQRLLEESVWVSISRRADGSSNSKRRCKPEGGVTLRTKPKTSKWVALGLDP